MPNSGDGVSERVHAAAAAAAAEEEKIEEAEEEKIEEKVQRWNPCFHHQKFSFFLLLCLAVMVSRIRVGPNRKGMEICGGVTMPHLPKGATEEQVLQAHLEAVQAKLEEVRAKAAGGKARKKGNQHSEIRREDPFRPEKRLGIDRQLIPLLGSSVIVILCVAVSQLCKKKWRPEEIDFGAIWEKDAAELDSFIKHGMLEQKYTDYSCLSLVRNRPWMSRPLHPAEVTYKEVGDSNWEWLADGLRPRSGGSSGAALRREAAAPLRDAAAKGKRDDGSVGASGGAAAQVPGQEDEAVTFPKPDDQPYWPSPSLENIGDHWSEERFLLYAEMAAFWRWVFHKKRPYWPFFLCIIGGLCAPLEAHLFGTIIGQISPTGNPYYLVKLLLMVLFVEVISTRAEFLFEQDVPNAQLRMEFAYRLYRHFLGMNGKYAEEWPAARCTAVMDYDVYLCVNKFWASAYTAAKTCTTLTALMLFTVYNNSWLKAGQSEQSHGPLTTLMGVAMFVVIFWGTVAQDKMREDNVTDLFHRKRNWQMMWTAYSTRTLGSERLRDKGEKTEYDDQGLTLPERTKRFAEVYYIFRKRNFHAFMMWLVSKQAPQNMVFLVKTFYCFCVGRDVIAGRMDQGHGAALIALMNILPGQIDNWVGLHLDIMMGYPSYLEIKKVFNTPVD